MRNNKLSKEIENRVLEGLNDFMKQFDINEINFGKTHSIVKTKGKKAKDIIKTKNQ